MNNIENIAIEMHDIGNSYGGLKVWETGGKFFWYIEDYDSHLLSLEDEGEEIPESLYKELLSHYYKEEAAQEVLHDERIKAQAAEQEARAVLEKQRDELYRKDNPISEYATPALMLQGYYDGHVDRDAMLRTFDEASVYHVVCDVTGLITLEDPMVPKSLSQATHQSSQHKPIR